MHSVCLIIDSDEPHKEHYERQRHYWMSYMSLDPDIKCYFIRLRPDLDQDVVIDEDHHILYVLGHESYVPGILQKTCKAMEYVYNHFDFKYLIRTNISSVWNFKTFRLFYDVPDKFLVRAPIGYEGNIPFPGGSGMVLARSVVRDIIKNMHLMRSDIYDDRSIGLLLNELNIPISDGENDRFRFETPLDRQTLLEQIKTYGLDKYTFRVKHDREEQDKFVVEHLIQLIYM